MPANLQTLHSGDGSDWRRHRAHPLVESVFRLISADDRPGGPIINNLLVGFFGARRSLGRKQKRRHIVAAVRETFQSAVAALQGPGQR